MATFGDTTYGGSSFPGSDGRLLVSKFTLSESATVTAIWVYGVYVFAGGHLKGAVLADSSGVPSTTLIVSSSSSAITSSGWVSLSASGSLSAGDYWLGIFGDSGAVDYGDDASGSGALMANGTFTFASPPGSWPGTDGSYGTQVNVYVEYTPASGGVSRLMMLGVG